jgi:hypothetical protein
MWFPDAGKNLDGSNASSMWLLLQAEHGSISKRKGLDHLLAMQEHQSI